MSTYQAVDQIRRITVDLRTARISHEESLQLQALKAEILASLPQGQRESVLQELRSE